MNTVYDISISELEKKLNQDQRIICYGGGQAFVNFLNEIIESELISKIAYVVDNFKRGKIDFHNKQYEIISHNELKSIIRDDDVIIITTKYYDDIISSIENKKEFNKNTCYIYRFLIGWECEKERLKKEIPFCDRKQSNAIIPKVIHYCWFGGKNLPAEFEYYISTWKKYNPDYEIVEWSESNYDVYANEYIAEAYDRGMWAFVSDFARLEIINKYGGVYFDTDVEVIRNIDDLLFNEAFCGFESKRWVAFGLGFGAKRNNSIIKELLDDYKSRKFVLEDGSYNMKTCPQYQTELLLKKGLICNGEYQVVDGITVYPELALCGMNPYTKLISQNLEKTYAIHHFSGSWLR